MTTMPITLNFTDSTGSTIIATVFPDGTQNETTRFPDGTQEVIFSDPSNRPIFKGDIDPGQQTIVSNVQNVARQVIIGPDGVMITSDPSSNGTDSSTPISNPTSFQIPGWEDVFSSTPISNHPSFQPPGWENVFKTPAFASNLLAGISSNNQPNTDRGNNNSRETARLAQHNEYRYYDTSTVNQHRCGTPSPARHVTLGERVRGSTLYQENKVFAVMIALGLRGPHMASYFDQGIDSLAMQEFEGILECLEDKNKLVNLLIRYYQHDNQWDKPAVSRAIDFFENTMLIDDRYKELLNSVIKDLRNFGNLDLSEANKVLTGVKLLLSLTLRYPKRGEVPRNGAYTIRE